MDIKQADIGLLVGLQALLETQSVTRAAKALNLSQPAMSAQLARLRAMFGDPLLVSSGRRLVPTSRAEALRDPLQKLLGDMDALIKEGRTFDAATSKATFRLIGTDYVHGVIAPHIATKLASAAPRARLALLPFDPSSVWSALEEDRADAALITGMQLADAKMRAGLEEDFLVIQRKGHARGTGPMTLEAFCTAEHVLVSPQGGGFSGAIDARLKKMGRVRRVACSVPGFFLVPSLIAASDYLCVLPRRIATQYASSLDWFDLPFPSPRFQIDLLWHPRRQQDPAHVWFRQQVSNAMRAVA
ncbi:LysR family transcriptional regulator [Cognatiyoonia sp. IB215182]|uniref:LysR family transcriptional regulator n=1 Tax=Cognatiyoonia sp. IB215182 TaxID=3097353 RepID=UPI002A10148F|nr:LysR family transcriptional regulator [Cognatiyoonia sp. IB215182]MDX8355033.1 LysR family transcriptional regulator [Cognatiyoonia sp. IB215182]